MEEQNGERPPASPALHPRKATRDSGVPAPQNFPQQWKRATEVSVQSPVAKVATAHLKCG